jgi:hypothetical protein
MSKPRFEIYQSFKTGLWNFRPVGHSHPRTHTWHLSQREAELALEAFLLAEAELIKAARRRERRHQEILAKKSRKPIIRGRKTRVIRKGEFPGQHLLGEDPDA